MARSLRHRDTHAAEHHARSGSHGLAISHATRSIRSSASNYRWECHCQEPPVLLGTYNPDGRINIKVRDRYWHLFGFGQVQAICPRCAAEHILDLAYLQRVIEGPASDID